MPRNFFQMLQQDPKQDPKKKPYSPSQRLLDLGNVPNMDGDPDELRAQEAQILGSEVRPIGPQPYSAASGPFNLPKSNGVAPSPFMPFGRFGNMQARQELGGQVMQGLQKELSSLAPRAETLDFAGGGDRTPPSSNLPSELAQRIAAMGNVPMEGANPAALESQLSQIEGQGGEGGGGQSLLQRLDAMEAKTGQESMAREAEFNPSLQGFGQFTGPVQDAVQDAVRQYGVAQNDYEKATLAMKREFQDTPEIDQALSSAQQALDMARSQRKQPSAWDYMAMALMNLSGVPPQTSAAMVLGLGDQQRNEERLEDRVAGLQNAKITNRISGRRDYQTLMAKLGMAQDENEIEAGKAESLQKHRDREFGFKQQDQMSDLLRALAGQDSETERASLDEATRKKAGASREKKLRMLQLDDASLEQMLRQRQQTQPQDKRQSRMFGGLVGDSFL